MTTPLSPVLDCTEFVAAEGRYELLQDIYLDQVLPHPVIPTHVSSVSVKYKDYLNSSNGGSGARAHGKQTSADSTLSASNLDRLEERLRDFKLRDEKGGIGDDDDDDGPVGITGSRPRSSSHGGTLSRNFHGNLVDLPLYHDDSSAGGGYKSPRSGMMSPGLSMPMTPGPPPLKDSTSSTRISDPYAQFGPPPQVPQQHQPPPHSFKSLSRASSHYSPAYEDSSNNSGSGSQSSFATGGSSAGFSSFFSSKRKKPKNNIAKTNSTFVAKITTHDNLAKILANRVGEDVCDHLDVIIGFSTGDIIWFDPLCNKYYRLNKQAIIKDSAVTMIRWLPGSENQFMAAFHDGSILIMDKERDDNTFTAPTPPNDNSFQVTKPKHSKHNPIAHWQVCKKPITAFAFSPDVQHVAVVAMDGGLRIIDFQQGRLLDTFSAYFGALNCVCWSPDGKYVLTGGQDDLVTIWSFKDQRIVARCQGHQSYVTGVAFDPWRCDERNYRFGSVGEDAKLLLWDFSVGALHKPKAAVMQRRGSNATVSGAAAAGSNGFKPGHGKNASFGDASSTTSSVHSTTLASESEVGGRPASTSHSVTTAVGEGIHDTLDAGSSNGVYKKSGHARTLPHLHMHKLHGSHQESTGHGFQGLHGQGPAQGHGLSAFFRQGGHALNNHEGVQIVRPPEPRSHVAMLQPLMAKGIHQEPLASITFREDAILTSDRRGHIKVWKRPPPLHT
ncbi:hypothetical protein BGX28_006704 [Mortierella sp. GBA30]|nr:hypothetical protein BGX28_006704 [Mortierella sp. GBA30]